MSTLIPNCKWAQNKKSIYLSIDLADVKDEKIELSNSKLTFKGKSENKDYSIDFNFYKEINTNESKYSVQPRKVAFHLIKDDEERWPNLLVDKNQYKKTLSIDWDRWADSDDEAPEKDFDLGGMDFQNFKPNEGDMSHEHCGPECDHGHGDPEVEEEDSDDENLPDLEEDK